MASELLKAFQEAYRNLDLLPLIDPKELEKFRVDYGAEVLEELQQLVEDDDSCNGKIIFAGHRGCGKSTLLAEFGRQCSDRYFVVFFSISDTIEMSDVNHINILFAIAVNLMYEAEKHQVNIAKSTKDGFYKWFATRTQIETEAINTEVSTGFDLLKSISGKLKAEATIRREIKREFERNISDLVAPIEQMAAVIQAATKKEVLVIIDDLDKLDLAVVKEVYQDHIKALFQPNFRIIFTTPISSLRETSLRATIRTEANDIVEMPVVKLFAKGERRKPDPIPRPEAEKTLCEILRKRIAPGLMEDSIAEQIVFYSGGVLRELIRITNKCCQICSRSIRRQPERTDIVINQAVLQEAIKDLRLDFEVPLGKVDYQILQTTYQEFTPDDPKDQKFLDLLHGLHILEYQNDEIWYDAHPIVIDLLKRKGLIHDT
ncbi:MAG TPA: P-loop NTPase fold protein [Allocoleopsis sp.]